MNEFKEMIIAVIALIVIAFVTVNFMFYMDDQFKADESETCTCCPVHGGGE